MKSYAYVVVMPSLAVYSGWVYGAASKAAARAKVKSWYPKGSIWRLS